MKCQATHRRLLLSVTLWAAMCLATESSAETRKFVEDYAAFGTAAGALHTIDFQTLPDGTPSQSSVEITADFNYSAQGAYFSTPIPSLLIAGNDIGGYFLRADAPFPHLDHTWIDAILTVQTYAVGVFFPGNTEMCAFDASGGLIDCVSLNSSGPDHFVGLIADVPIHSVRMDSGGPSESIQALVFAPVPEPAGAMLLLFGLLPFRRTPCSRLDSRIS